MTAINNVVTRSDLADRTLHVQVPRLAGYLPETQLTDQFRRIWASALGALLDAAVGALASLPTLQLTPVSRMADFEHWVAAAEPSLGWPTGTFQDQMRRNRREATDNMVDGSPVAQAIGKLLDQQGQWEGTSTDLFTDLTRIAGPEAKTSKGWPRNKQALSCEVELVEAAPARSRH